MGYSIGVVKKVGANMPNDTRIFMVDPFYKDFNELPLLEVVS